MFEMYELKGEACRKLQIWNKMIIIKKKTIQEINFLRNVLVLLFAAFLIQPIHEFCLCKVWYISVKSIDSWIAVWLL